MRRMILDCFEPRPGEVDVLTSDDCSELERLYASDDRGGDAFGAFQSRTGYFRGIRQGGEIVAVAGVHVASKQEGVAAVGNVFTRSDWRGQGLAQIVTSAVVMSLLNAGFQDIGLNVEDTNAAALSAYEHIGFRTRFHVLRRPGGTNRLIAVFRRLRRQRDLIPIRRLHAQQMVHEIIVAIMLGRPARRRRDSARG